ncbi:MAG TPA: 8-amino-7-oxononanoate synthase [Verrucomicrobiales bacterium]|jgi:8-amino-7-oxononanoate synthase|nr:8-amino-7-oxononanoate synthase [Verrucomicrobiales bacterium]HIL71640.1 8-amino-7-oxononanoate synthase [Verrucomicrobiota bacterium]
MTGFNQEIQKELDQIQSLGFRRNLRAYETLADGRLAIERRFFLNFSSNDYLGIARDPRLQEVAVEAMKKWGVGTGASRLICGNLRPHIELEESLADWKKSEAGIVFSSGYSAAIGTVNALVDKNDLVITDQLIHASLIDAARLSKAEIQIYPHNDLNELQCLLEKAQSRFPRNSSRILILTESVFSMDGDIAPLREIVELKDRFGACLMLDEAHATGLYGPEGAGLSAREGVENRIEVRMGTLSKALGVSGGFICGSQALIDLLINRARPFIFSTSPPAMICAAASEALRIVRSEEGDCKRTKLWGHVELIAAELRGIVNHSSSNAFGQSAIFPLVLGSEERAMEGAQWVGKEGLLIHPVRYPSVPKGEARLRMTVSADHTEQEIETLLSSIKRLYRGGDSIKP